MSKSAVQTPLESAMKKSHYLRMLAYEPGFLLAVLLVGGFCSWSSISHFRLDETFFLGFVLDWTFAVFLIPMAFLFLFKPRNSAGIKGSQSALAGGDLEFHFTRAISRRSIYWAKATRYLLACLLPLLFTWAFSSSKPLIRVTVPFDEGKQASMEQFYLSHFHGSHVQTVPLEENATMDYVILPHGQMNKTFLTLTLGCFVALLLQFISFFFWGNNRAMTVTWFAFVFLPSLLMGLTLTSTTSSTMDDTSPFAPTFYESVLAWVTLHASLALLILAVATIATQTYCCRRYIRAEITA